MNIATRMRKVREIMGCQQSAVATSMNISQQAFSYIEEGNGSPGIDVLDKFCSVMNVHLHFLMATDVPVTEETVTRFGSKSFSEFISDYSGLKNGVEMFDHFMTVSGSASQSPLAKS